MNASGVVKLLYEKKHILEGMTMNIRALVLLGILTGFSLHMSCRAQEIAQEDLLASSEQVGDQGQANEQLPGLDFDLGDMSPDDLFAEIQAFEQENPQQDIPLEAKIKLAWEYLKIKVNEHKVCIVGTAVLSTAALAGLCLLYKYHVRGNAAPVQ